MRKKERERKRVFYFIYKYNFQINKYISKEDINTK